MKSIQSICLFCGSRHGARPEYAEAARAFGSELAKRGITLVYGGGNVGLMGVAADACLAAGGKVIGVIPEFLKSKEVAHLGLTELYITDSMHVRKAKMAELSDAFIALPGGFGTFDELFEILTWAQLAVHDKPVGLLNVAGFFDPLLAMTRHAVDEGFARPENLSLFAAEKHLPELLHALENHQPRHTLKWVDAKNG
ncbi:TIGR00730 family Rossman fold protein [Aquitalea sp. S1-19]|nr:TIGR00730 family Rossman fold protein [Aquitalea sp. S1-19]